MHRLQAVRRLTMAFASLALMASPFGCGSGEPTAAVPAPPVVVADAPSAADLHAPSPSLDVDPNMTVKFTPIPPNGVPIGTFERSDPEVRLTGELKGIAADARQAVNDAEANVHNAATDAQAEAKRQAGAIKSGAQQAVEYFKAGAFQGVGATKNNARKAVADAESKAKDKINAVEEEVRKAAEDALNKLLPPSKP